MKNLRITLVIFFSTFIIFGFFAFFHVDTQHDGAVLTPTMDMLSGRMLFRDTLTQYGALFYVINYWMMKTFGPYLLVVRFVTCFFYAATATVLWHIQKRFLPPVYTIASWAIYIVLAPMFTWYLHSWSSVYAAFFQCLSMWMMIRFVETKRPIYTCICGLLVAIAFWCRQPVGMLLCALYIGYFGLLFLYERHIKQTLYVTFVFALGFICGLLPIFFWLYKNNALWDWWLQSIKVGPVFAQAVRGTSLEQWAKSLLVVHFMKTWLFFTYLHWIYIPLSCVMVALYTFFTLKKHQTNHIVFLVSAVGVTSWIQYYPISEPLHYYWSCMPMFGIAVYLGYQFIEKCTPHRQRLIKGTIAGLIISMLLAQTYHGIIWVHDTPYTIDNPKVLKGIYLDKTEYDLFTSLNKTFDEYFQDHPGATYINYSSDSFLPLVHSHYGYPHKVYVDWDFINQSIYPEYEETISRYIDRYHPLIFAPFPEKFPNYRVISAASNQTPRIYLLAPKK